jgi:hypothetical protein
VATVAIGVVLVVVVVSPEHCSTKWLYCPADTVATSAVVNSWQNNPDAE